MVIPMVYDMQLNDDPFKKIQQGSKDIELRLYDEKRRRLDINDIIIFTNITDANQQLAVVISALYRYPSFEALFFDFSPERCGFAPGTNIMIASQQMQQYYSMEKTDALGVLGIRFKVADLKQALYQKERQNERRINLLFPDGLK